MDQFNLGEDLSETLKGFSDTEIRTYTRFATEWRDQRLTDGTSAEVAFWNSVINLLVEEKYCRKEQTRALEEMFKAGDRKDPDCSLDM